MVLTLSLVRDKPRRFNALRREIEGVTQKMLSQTLKQMERDGLVTRTVLPTIAGFGRICNHPARPYARGGSRQAPALGARSHRRRARREAGLRRERPSLARPSSCAACRYPCLPPGGRMTRTTEIRTPSAACRDPFRFGSIITIMRIGKRYTITPPMSDRTLRKR